MKVFACVLLTALALAASDVSGRWTGSVLLNTPEGGKESTALLVLKQNGSEITGTVGPADRQLPITKGTIEGNKIALEVSSEGPRTTLALTLEGEHLWGDITMSNGDETRTAKIDVTRAK